MERVLGIGDCSAEFSAIQVRLLSGPFLFPIFHFSHQFLLVMPLNIHINQKTFNADLLTPVAL
ncbi:MAG: hypothetical protein ACK40M_03315, partial [Flavobacteriales bacterium]